MSALSGAMIRLRQLSGGGRQGLWAILEYLVYPLLMFAATPLLLRSLGPAQYGQWLLLLTFNGFGGLAGFGMGTVVVKHVSEQRGIGDLSNAVATVRNGLALTLVSTGMLCGAIIAVGMTAGPSLLARMGAPATVTMIFASAAGLIALEQIDIVFASAIRGLERFDWSARLEAGSKLLTITGAVVAALFTHRLGPVIAVTLMLTLLRALVKSAMASRLLATGVILPAWEPTRLRSMLSFGLWTWAQMIGAMLLGTVDRFLVGGMLGTQALAHYSVSLQLAQQVHAIPAAAAQILLPRISRAEKGSDLSHITRTAFVLVGVLTAILALPLFLLGHEILRLWVGIAIADNAAPILRVVLAAYVLLALCSVAHFILLGLGRAKIVAQLSLAGGAVSLAITYLLIRHYVLVGAALSRVTYGLLSCMLIVELVRQLRRNGLDRASVPKPK